ncbi:Arv1-like family-domain-containing protein [Phlebopus sp. FC_14]|nr:Arv1-like family-domain-containing protein [Phlebopus sp. FC_14]
MPICTTCTHQISHLYTVYESAYNLRLEQCSKCLAFADPYVEHDSLTFLLDLILLKRGVFRHLLYNRGTEPRKAYERNKLANSDVVREDVNTRNQQQHDDGSAAERDPSMYMTRKELAREKARWLHILRLGSGLLLVDAFIRWAQLNPEISSDVSLWTTETNSVFLRILVGCLIETVAFHGGVTLASYVVLKISDQLHTWKHARPHEISGVRQQFKLSLVPLTILYSSFTKYFLLFLLTIWRPSASRPGGVPYRFDTSHYQNPVIVRALEIWDEDKLDREWVVRNVLGGMAAGFGLRGKWYLLHRKFGCPTEDAVVLDCHPIFTTLVILFGWLVKTAVAELLKGWVGADDRTGEVWLAYSIP